MNSSGPARLPRTMSIGDVVDAIRRTDPPGSIGIRIVAVDGLGGAGKSTLADRLAASLDGAPIVHTDDFASWDNPLDWWPRMIDQVLQPLAAGELACFKRYDWTSRQLEEWIEIPRGDCLVVEGVSASRFTFRRYLTYSIWVEASRETRLRRGLDRDGDAMREQWLHWMALEDDYVQQEQPHLHADLVVCGEPSTPHDPSRQVIVLDR